MRLIRALRDCKQRSFTVSIKAPTVSEKASPLFFSLFLHVGKRIAKVYYAILHAILSHSKGVETLFSHIIRAATLQKCGSESFLRFLCQRCREIWREILVKFSVLRFPGFGCARENFTNISLQKRCEKRKISRKFHSAGRSADTSY